jgi:hypothetical protein
MVALETEVASLKAANDKLTTVSSEMEALKKAVAAFQSMDRRAVRNVALNK